MEITIIEPTGEEIEATLAGEQGAKQLANKIPVELLPWLPIMAIAQVLQFGALKYDDWNWYKGLPITTCVASCFRHLMKFMLGEDTDDESGLPHLAHAGCNILFALQFFLEGRGDNRPKFKSYGLSKLPEPDEDLWNQYANVMNLDK